MSKKVKIDKAMEENIRNYNKQIQTIDDFVQVVRKMPGMYIGRKGNLGFLNMIREIFQNSVDELEKKDSPCTWINVLYDSRTLITTVEDNGRGIPFESMIRIFTSEHTSSNYTKKEGEFSSGLHGVGSKVTNALSEWFEVESYILGEARKVRFVDGKVTKEGVVKIPNPNNKQGTIVRFKPSVEAMGNMNLTVEEVLGLIILILPLTKIGSVINFTGVFADGKTMTKNMVNQDGIITNLIMKTSSPVIKPIVISRYTGRMTADIAFTYDSNDLMVESITAFANFCPTIEGTHVNGLMDGLCQFMRNYMNKVYLANNKKNKLQVINNDIKLGLKAIISVKHLEPVFTGQAKDILGNEDMEPFVKQVVIESLEQWSKENPKDLQKLCKYYKEIAEIRMKSEKEKVKLSNKYTSSALTGLPKKYEKPEGKEHLEFIICEGDSALSSGKNSRCKQRQGIFPIRGKLPNAFTTDRAKFLDNAEIAAIITIIGGGYGRNFDLSKVKWEKIIFMTDADPDGKHIAALLLKFILLYMPQLIEDGRVYKAVPPLYSIEIGKHKHKYLTNRMDYVQYVQKSFMSDYKITTLRNGTLTNKEVSKILYENIDYTYYMESLTNKYALNCNLLELVLLNLDKGIDELRNIIVSKYRFMNIEIMNDIPVIKGLIDGKYQTLFLNERFLSDCKDMLEYIRSRESMYYRLNGEVTSLYTLMKSFESHAPKNLQRYKGLGEMKGYQLAESTLHPDSDRTLYRYTLEDAVKEIEMIRYYESNKNELFKDVKVTRLDLIG